MERRISVSLERYFQYQSWYFKADVAKISNLCQEEAFRSFQLLLAEADEVLIEAIRQHENCQVVVQSGRWLIPSHTEIAIDILRKHRASSDEYCSRSSKYLVNELRNDRDAILREEQNWHLKLKSKLKLKP